MVNSEELIGTAEYLTLWTRCGISQCRYNRVRLCLNARILMPLLRLINFTRLLNTRRCTANSETRVEDGSPRVQETALRRHKS
jgi:hypothetical protein